MRFTLLTLLILTLGNLSCSIAESQQDIHEISFDALGKYEQVQQAWTVEGSISKADGSKHSFMAGIPNYTTEDTIAAIICDAIQVVAGDDSVGLHVIDSAPDRVVLQGYSIQIKLTPHDSAQSPSQIDLILEMHGASE